MRYYLSIGANLGERERTIRQAVKEIEEHVGHVSRCSSFYYSEPWGFQSEHAFCNLCCAVETEKEPLDMLSLTQAIERNLGREKHPVTGEQQARIYSDRNIDIDIILAFDDDGKEIQCLIPDDSSPTNSVPLLVLPHPLWRERDFVKKPLSEICTIPK
ncbi:MAG: 2-amino-4-hydroxy-6-hydroxymethyldihydropteridine diphosphokinase [Paludibacteraceae bacterium]|jgi:2-amino-4-hydroxy-6-hydroxymethyldihydropteridine diphosphokinase|nr:2-amino-4-hydroxy-6-hydroxymethyldihydropteridine diphosphokinase [Paludibacteraceae bacterium]